MDIVYICTTNPVTIANELYQRGRNRKTLRKVPTFRFNMNSYKISRHFECKYWFLYPRNSFLWFASWGRRISWSFKHNIRPWSTVILPIYDISTFKNLYRCAWDKKIQSFVIKLFQRKKYGGVHRRKQCQWKPNFWNGCVSAPYTEEEFLCLTETSFELKYPRTM
jgi:hypothetical protein